MPQTAEPVGAGDDLDPKEALRVADALAAARRRSGLWRILRWAAVPVLLVCWIGGWIIPVVPGFPFLIVALVLMSPDIPAARRLVIRIQRKFPRMRRLVPKRWRRTRHGP